MCGLFRYDITDGVVRMSALQLTLFTSLSLTLPYFFFHLCQFSLSAQTKSCVLLEAQHGSRVNQQLTTKITENRHTKLPLFT